MIIQGCQVYGRGDEGPEAINPSDLLLSLATEGGAALATAAFGTDTACCDFALLPSFGSVDLIHRVR